MKTTSLGPRVTIMHAPKKRYCVYSGDVISSGNIAVSIAPELDHYSSSWMSLGSISEVIDAFHTFRDNPAQDSFPAQYQFHQGGIYEEEKLTVYNTGNCAMCDNSTVDHPIVYFADNRRKDPCVHIRCLPDLIEQLRKIPEIVPSEEVVASRI